MTTEKGVKEFRNIEKVADLLDSKFRIPGTKFRFGLEPVISLIPFLGDGVTLIMQGGLVLIMARHGVSGRVVALMVVNVLLDFLISSIPLIGNIFDFFFKANTRNLKLLKAHYTEGRHQGSAAKVIVIAAIVLLVAAILLLWALWEVLEWAWHAVT
ncbi:MAG: DUF4112 domain-containing protein [Bacteroidia bacterium]